MLLGGIELSGQQKYGAAASVFDAMIEEMPEHPVGYLNKAILLQVMSLDYETPIDPAYNKLVSKTRKLAELMLKKDKHSSEGYYYLGMSHSYYAYSAFRDGKNWLDGLKYGMSAYDNLKLSLKYNPKAYDAMTGVGTYMYWKSRKMDFLTWTPFVDDDRDEGIAMLKRSAKHASYTATQSVNALIWIYIEEERWGDAIKAAKGVLKRYPDHRLFLWGLASAAEGNEDWKLALSAYRRIVASVDKHIPEPRYILIQARAKIGRMAMHLGDTKTAARECRWVLSQKGVDSSLFTNDGANRIARRIEDMEDLKEELGSAYAGKNGNGKN
jgi:Tetratricopeptide repeat